MTLEAARARRDEAKALLRQGVDPGAHKRRMKAAQAESLANTFESVADELLARKKRDDVAPVTASKVEWLLGMAKASLGSLPIGSITAGEVLRVLQPLEADGKLETARRLRPVIGAVFRHAAVTARAANDPTQALKGAVAAPKVKSRAAIIDTVAFGVLLKALDYFKGQPTTKAALQLLAMLVLRPGELRQAKWDEFSQVLRSATGLSPHAYVMHCRVQHACSLIAAGKLPLIEIASLCGFSDQAHMTVTFRKVLGFPPSHFTKAVR